MTEEEPPDAPATSSQQKIGCLGIVLVLLLIGFIINLFNGDRDDAPPTPSGREVATCPDYLDVAGPYRQGIDPAYDPAMDWDNDGVSCE